MLRNCKFFQKRKQGVRTSSMVAWRIVDSREETSHLRVFMLA